MSIIWGFEMHELIAIIVAIGMVYVVLGIIRIKAKIKVFEGNDLEEKLLMAQTAELLRKATVETAANLRDATVETAKHLKETTIETARILSPTDSPIESCKVLLSSINNKLDKIINDLDIVIEEHPEIK
jgi:hypothetical protein